MIRHFLLVLLLSLPGLCEGCSDSRSNGNQALAIGETGRKGKRRARERIGEMAASANTDIAAKDCDKTLWQHVYKPDRLIVISECTVASGVIADPRPDDDGDMHANLMLDPGQESMVNKRNMKKKNGGLVIEIVCSVQPKGPPAAIQTCQGYHAALRMPPAGTHVRVTGTHVNDSHNGWLEIHPVSKIEALK
jgi:hypothetical protein